MENNRDSLGIRQREFFPEKRLIVTLLKMILPLSIDVGIWIIIEKDQIQQVIDVFKAHGIMSRTHQNSILLIVESLCFVFALSLKTC